MNCKISDWTCVYHACLTDECQRHVVISQGFDLGDCKCKNNTSSTQEECDHHWLTDVQLGDYVECELCGLIFPKSELKKLRDNENR